MKKLKAFIFTSLLLLSTHKVAEEISKGQYYEPPQHLSVMVRFRDTVVRILGKLTKLFMEGSSFQYPFLKACEQANEGKRTI